jgi:multidrug resistance efflux pump
MKNLFAKLRNPRVLRVLLSVLAIAIITGGLVYFLKTEHRVSIENSLLQAPVTAIAPATPGKIKAVYVTVGDKVKKGDALALVGNDIIRADFDGLVTATSKDIGGTSTGQTPVVSLINTNNLRVDGTIDENKGLNEIKVGQVVSFTVDALPGKTFWGYVDELSPSAKSTAASFSISSERPTQQFEVYAHFDAAGHPEIKNGMSAKMTVFTK